MLSTALMIAFLTPQYTQKNHCGQHFWPNLFLGRWLKGESFFREAYDCVCLLHYLKADIPQLASR